MRLFDFAQPEFYPVIGNHEYYVWEKTPTEGEKPTTEQVFDTMCSHFATKLSARGPLGSYVLCRLEEKVCYLTVPCDFDCLISDDLIAFPAEECRKIPEGYACIVVGHAFVNNDAAPSVIRHDHQPLCALFDAVDVDLDRCIIHLTRIGAGENREYTY